MAERVLVTGATGFTGPAVIAHLQASGYVVSAAGRRPSPAADVENIAIGDLGGPVDWRTALAGVDHVVHLAGLAHAGPGLDAALYRRINTEATLGLAEAARAAGIHRFVHLSSVKALTGAAAGSFSDADPPQPEDVYGRSKLAAEQGLAALDLDWIALRPVLVYGPGAKANMAALMRLAALPVPLPFGALTAPRSLLAVENLAEAIRFALTPQCPPRRAYLVADPEPIGVAGLVAALREGAGRPPGLIAVPPGLLGSLARLLGRRDAFAKLAGGLAARPDDLLRAGWRPLVTTPAALAALGRSRRAR